MRKRIGALGLAAVLLLTLICPALAANGKAEFIVNAPASVKAGETFTVTVELKDNPGFSSLQFAVPYDTGALDCEYIVPGDVLTSVLCATNPTAPGGAMLAAAAASLVTRNGEVAEIGFKAKTDISALDFKLDDILISGENGAALAYTAPEVEKPTSAQPADPAPTDPTQPAGPSGTQDPAQPANPGGVTDPEQPEDPDQPTVPETPAQPVPADLPTFTDTKGHWGEVYIGRAAQLGLFKGYPDGRFGPNDPVTRAQFITVLYRMAGSPAVTAETPFTDIANQSEEFRNAIAWGYEKGYVSGRSADTFDPSGKITRQEAMKLLFGYAGGVSGMEAMLTPIYDGSFTDSGEIADWGRSAMYWGVYNELISGTSADTLSPGGTATRAQLAKILVNYLDKNAQDNPQEGGSL